MEVDTHTHTRSTHNSDKSDAKVLQLPFHAGAQLGRQEAGVLRKHIRQPLLGCFHVHPGRRLASGQGYEIGDFFGGHQPTGNPCALEDIHLQQIPSSNCQFQDLRRVPRLNSNLARGSDVELFKAWAN